MQELELRQTVIGDKDLKDYQEKLEREKVVQYRRLTDQFVDGVKDLLEGFGFKYDDKRRK